MQISLILGAHRTGTTTLDALLTANRARLASAGIAYWGRQERDAGLLSQLSPMNASGMARRPTQAARGVANLRTLLETLEDDGVERLIWCEPQLVGALRPMLEQAALYPDLADRLARIEPALYDRCDRIVLSVRAYDAFWRSALAETIRAGHACPDQAHLARLGAQSRRWRHVVEEVAQVLPHAEAHIAPFEAISSEATAQVALAADPAIARALEPLAPGQDRLSRSPTPKKLHRILAARGADAQALPICARGLWRPFAQTDAARMTQAYAEDVAWLRQGASGLAHYHPDASAARRAAHDHPAIVPVRGAHANDRHAQNHPHRLGRSG